jgi:hypothetical protein
MNYCLLFHNNWWIIQCSLNVEWMEAFSELWNWIAPASRLYCTPGYTYTGRQYYCTVMSISESARVVKKISRLTNRLSISKNVPGQNFSCCGPIFNFDAPYKISINVQNKLFPDSNTFWSKYLTPSSLPVFGSPI